MHAVPESVTIKGMRTLVSLVVVLLIVFVGYRYFLMKSVPGTDGAPPTAAITLTGVQNDLRAIAQAQRLHHAQRGSYATLDELVEAGSLTVDPRGREGYTYEMEVTTRGFLVTARPPNPGDPGRPAMQIDQAMEIRKLD